jgi:hypothetical protein
MIRIAEKEHTQLNVGSEPCCRLDIPHSQRFIHIKREGRERHVVKSAMDQLV